MRLKILPRTKLWSVTMGLLDSPTIRRKSEVKGVKINVNRNSID